jgi:uncharacterized protein YqeY
MYDKIQEDIKSALKSGDRSTADILKFLKSKLDNTKIELGRDLNDEEVMRVIRREIKSRIEARDIYIQNNRQELANKEEAERLIYEKYLPSDLNDEEITKIIEQASSEVGDSREFAKIMPIAMKLVAGRANGKRVSEAVNNYLKG